MDELTYKPAMHPLVLAILTLLVSAVGFVLVGPLIGFFISIPFMDGSILEQTEKLANPIGYPEFRLPLYIMQGCATFIGLTVIPLIFSFGVARQGIKSFFGTEKIYVPIILLVFILTLSFMAANSVIIFWNAHVHFPEALSGFESWARTYEDRAEELTKFMTQFSSTGEFTLAFVVIALLPAIGEELVFRGMLQRQLQDGVKNIHVAIWTSAIIFSAFHLQFFGFVPRMLLGGFFGYLYYWSGNLWMPVFAHFVNNGFSVIMLYLNQKGVVDVDVESTDVVAPWPAIAIFTLLATALLIYYKNFFDKKRAANG